MSHTLIEQSPDVDATCLPLGEKRTLRTLPVWPASLHTIEASMAFQTTTVQSHEAETTSESSGEKAQAVIGLVCPPSADFAKVVSGFVFRPMADHNMSEQSHEP